MTTSPRVALCVVLGSWGALLVAAGVAGERQSHATSHRICQAPLAARMEIRGAAALAGIHLDYLYTDDACGHTAPISACGMTVCYPFDRPADQTVQTEKTPAPLDTYSDNYDADYESSDYENGNYEDYRNSSKYNSSYRDENYDDESRYYEVLGDEYAPAVEARKPAPIADSTDDVYYDDLRGEYVPSVESYGAKAAKETADDPYYDEYEGHEGAYTPSSNAGNLNTVKPSANAPYYDDFESEYSPNYDAYAPKVADDSEWDDGARGWHADPQDTDDVDANIWDTDAPNVNSTRTPANLDVPYYGEADPCDDWCALYQPRVVTGSLAQLTANPFHSIGQALAITLNFENDGLPKVQFPAAPQVIAHLMSIETIPNLPAWMYGNFAFGEDWHGCGMPYSANESVPYSACEMTPYSAGDLDAYPGCELERMPVTIPDSTWTENRIHSTSSFVWDESYEDYCHPDFDGPSDSDRAINLALRQEIIRLGLIPTAWSATVTWNNYRALWNDIAGGMGQFAQDLAVVTKWAGSARNSASANRPVRGQPNLHLGL